MVWSLEDMLAPPGAKKPLPGRGYHSRTGNPTRPSISSSHHYSPNAAQLEHAWTPAVYHYAAAAVAWENQKAASGWATPAPAPSPHATWQPSSTPYHRQLEQGLSSKAHPPSPAIPHVPVAEEGPVAAEKRALPAPKCRPSRSRSKPRSSRNQRRTSRSRSDLSDRVDSQHDDARTREATREWVRAHIPADGTRPGLLPSAMRQAGVRPRRQVHWYDPTEASSENESTVIDDPTPSRWAYHSYVSTPAPPPAESAFIHPSVVSAVGAALASPHHDLSRYDIHPLLCSNAILWDITTLPSTALIRTTTPTGIGVHTYLADPAFPSTPARHLQQPVTILPNLPWPNAEKWLALWGPIVVRPCVSPGPPMQQHVLSHTPPPPPPSRIRFQDVLDAIHAFFQAPLTPQDRAYMSAQEWWAVSQAMARRVASGPTNGDLLEAARRRGVLRADVLSVVLPGPGSRAMFGGMWAVGAATVGMAITVPTAVK
ncbi:hypothetical protein MKEN_00283700 [Mycena kentingensis (nom. inval.)]|nr:hypothetical protein MKEN_00283700 [Mycena kentingensis (nom. inval.)]